MRRKFIWIAGYKCGCSADADRKSDLLEYCGVHGDNRNELYAVPKTKLGKE